MNNLTEQWTNGKLPTGAYYVLLATDEIFPDFYNTYGYFENFDSLVEKILAPVPSYEEWQAKNEENKNLYKMLDVLNGHLDSLLKEDKENQQIKELLKECVNKIKEVTHILSKKPSIENTVTAHSILRKFMSEIDNAIGEKSEKESNL